MKAEVKARAKAVKQSFAAPATTAIALLLREVKEKEMETGGRSGCG
jgi:hypothetical protein